MWPVTKALITLIIAMGGVVLNQVMGSMVKAEQEHLSTWGSVPRGRSRSLIPTRYGRGAAACARC